MRYPSGFIKVCYISGCHATWWAYNYVSSEHIHELMFVLCGRPAENRASHTYCCDLSGDPEVSSVIGTTVVT